MIQHILKDVFYSRKNFQRPNLQLAGYRTFEQEVMTLDKFFVDGAGMHQHMQIII